MRNLRAMHRSTRLAAGLVGLSAILTLSGGAGTALAVTPSIQVAGGKGYSCGLITSSQQVWCWGALAGSGRVPSQVNVPNGAIAIAGGLTHACAIDTKNNVWCWGSDLFGELGNGTTGASFGKPAKVAGLKATQISAGSNSTCAVTLAATVDCWGDNNYGELGDGSTNDASTPQPVSSLTGVKQVAVGYFHTCAVTMANTVDCWGDNGNGELGRDPTSLLSSDVPLPVTEFNASYVAAGLSDTCAIDPSGALLCWGSGFDGVLGNGDVKDRDTPTPVLGLGSGVRQVSLGLEVSCALTTQVLCWGDGSEGQLGDGHWSAPPRPAPGPVFNLQSSPAGGSAGPQQISATYDHVCVSELVPVTLAPPMDTCWGRGLDGELGNGIIEEEDIPTDVIGLPLDGAAAYANTASVGPVTGCASTNNLEAECWGMYPGNGDTTTAFSSAQDTQLGKVVSISAGFGACALLASETVSCWGDNSHGQLGNGSSGSAVGSPPAPIALSQVLQVSVGSTHACASVHNGTMDCWGDDSHGQLGDGGVLQQNSPVSVVGLPQHPVQITAGAFDTCALMPNGHVYCWGDNTYGQLGANGKAFTQSSMPVLIQGLSGVIQVEAGGEFVCALTYTGAVYCWGDNSVGELGNNSTTPSIKPVMVQGLGGGVASIAAGDIHACAMKQVGGALVCWGDNSAGELGNGIAVPNSLVPVPVQFFGSGGALSLSSNFSGATCATDQTFHVSCWGDNANDELGNGTSVPSSNSPTTVTGIS